MAENINIAGRLHSTATGNVVAGANEIYDDTKGKKQSVVNQETDAALDDRYPKSQTYNKTELNNLITTPNQEYVSVTATDQTTAATDVLPATGSADTTYRVGNWDGSQFDASVYSEYAWDGSQYVHLSTKTQVGEVFDISAYHATGGTLATYADLAAALDSNNGGGVPQSLRKGGMSVKYVQTYDNKYAQFRYMSTSTAAADFTNINNWQEVFDELRVGIAKVFNGSLGNPGDAKTCHTCVVPTFGAKYVFINTTRKPHSGYHYVYEATLTDSKSDIGKGERRNTLVGNLTSIDGTFFPASTYLDISSVPSAVGVSIRVFEVSDAATSQQTLDVQNIGASDFEGEVFQIICTDAIERLIELSIKNEAINPQNRFLSSALFEKSYEQPIEYEVGNILVSSSGWTYTAGTYNVRTPQGFELHLYPGDVIKLTDYTKYHFDYGARLLDNTYIYFTNKSSDFVVEKEGYYVICSRYLTAKSISFTETVGSLIKVIRNNGVRTQVAETLNILGANLCSIYNGSIGNPGAVDYVHTQVFLTNGAKLVRLVIDRPAADGNYYTIGYALTSSKNDFGRHDGISQWSGAIINTNPGTSEQELTVDVSDYPNAVGIAFTIAEYNGSSYVNLREGDFVSYLTYAFASNLIEKEVKEIVSTMDIGGGYESWNKDVIWRNGDREIALAAMCRYNISLNPVKDLQLCMVSDSHGDNISLRNSVIVTNEFKTVDALIHAGDIMPSYVEMNHVETFRNIIAESNKPVYVVIGNHDVGNSKNPALCCNSVQAYNFYIKQMVDNGWLVSGEYQTDIPYWFHDDSTYKVRIIGLCEYEAPMDLANSDYWEPVTYDSSKPNIARNTSYTAGDIVNCNNFNVPYTEYSFRCKISFTTPNGWYAEDGTMPNFKIHRGYRVIQQTQAQWFLDKLASTPANYGVVIVMHQAVSNVLDTVNCKFNDMSSKPNIQTCMETDFIYNAISAFISGSNYSENIVMKGDAAYLNTQGSGTYAYSVSKNFASKNTGVYLLGIVGGHSHRDIVLKKDSMYQINVVSANPHPNINNSKLCRSYGDTVNDVIRDSLTVISYAQGRIGLAKVGVNVTYDGTARDYEVIITSV